MTPSSATGLRIATFALLCVPACGLANPAEPELVAVTAPRELSERSAPFANATSIVLPEASPSPPRALAELLQHEPGVDFNGQGGLFQTIAIRGMGRQRIGSYFLDVPLFSERRAGTAASFVDPVMMEAVELVRGPSSIQHGFGAIGGLMRIHPQERSGLSAGLGWGSSGDENLQHVAYGAGQMQLALSHRGGDETKTAAGQTLNNGFDQYNAHFAADLERGDIQYSANSLFSYADDIGKSNALFPDERITDYPRERHWLGQLAAEREGNWRGSVFFHLQDLETRVERLDQRLNEVDNRSADYGAKVVLFRGTEKAPLRIGVDYLARRDVDADEKQTDFDTGLVGHTDILHAEQDELALFSDFEHGYRQLQWAAGLRLASLWQDAAGFSSESDTYANGFAAVEWFASDPLSFSLQASAGQRPAGLSERYFSGNTGRGTVLGNPDLDSEKAFTVDLGSRWESDAGNVAVHGFYTRLDDLIERIPVGTDALSFRNNREGEIAGAEISAQLELSDAWLLSIAGNYLDSEDDDGNTLQDTTANRLSAGLQYRSSRRDISLRYEHRFSRNDVAQTELPVDSADLLSARILFRLGDRVSLAFWGRNLLDDEYTISADDLSTEGEERALGVNLSWHSQ